MAKYNTGDWTRTENGGKLWIGAAVGSIQETDNLVPGTLRWRCPGRERIANMDRGVYGNVIPGDVRPQEVEFQLYRTSVLPVLVAIMNPAIALGVLPPFALRVQEPNYDGAAAGYQWTFLKCQLVNGDDNQGSGSGQDVDKITFRAVSYEGRVVPETY